MRYPALVEAVSRTVEATSPKGDQVWLKVRDALGLKPGVTPPKSKMATIVKEILKHTTDKWVAEDVMGTFYKGLEGDVFDRVWKSVGGR